MSHVLKAIYDVIAVILMFGASIFLHELGHFLVARRRGLKVEEFAIGFGPKIFGWRKNGIDYTWRWIPAGGFVKLPQMMTSDALEGGRKDSDEQLRPPSPWSKILVAFAGPFMNVVFAFVVAVLIYFVGLPVMINPSVIGYVNPKSPEAKMGIQENDRIVEVDGHKVSSWEDVQSDTVMARTNVIPVVIERNGARTTYRLTTTVSDTIGLKMLNLDPRDHAVIEEVVSGSRAESAGLKAGDEVVSVNNVPVYGQQRFVEMIQALAQQPAEIVIIRNKERMTIPVTPALDPATQKGRIGAVITTSSATRYQVQRPGPAPWTLMAEKAQIIFDTFGALIHSKQTGVGPKDLAGPVGIISMLAVWVNTDYRLALNFLVFLNVNLAMLNLLPLPVLDGGHILTAVIEWIRRRPMNVRVMEYSTTVFAVLLISFLVYITYADLGRLRLFRSAFKQEMIIEQPGTNSDSLAPVKP